MITDLQKKLNEIREGLGDTSKHKCPECGLEPELVGDIEKRKLLECVEEVYKYCNRMSGTTKDDLPDDLSREAWGQMLLDDIEYKLRAILVEDGNGQNS